MDYFMQHRRYKLLGVIAAIAVLLQVNAVLLAACTCGIPMETVDHSPSCGCQNPDESSHCSDSCTCPVCSESGYPIDNYYPPVLEPDTGADTNESTVDPVTSRIDGNTLTWTPPGNVQPGVNRSDGSLILQRICVSLT